MPDLQLVSDLTPTMGVNAVESSIFPACAVTRAAAKRTQKKAKEISITVDTRDDFGPPIPSHTSQGAREDGITEHCPSMKQQQLIEEQQHDVELSQLVEEAISEEEMANYAHCYYVKSGVLMRKWRPQMHLHRNNSRLCTKYCCLNVAAKKS